ncbi:hypothetical protein CALVIDRAFT_594696 [Calocera viscosa TUFC12733]|uniref:Uncharacterized protein n=1 Tax=Calocera viscosa (strain TUFC12733) TaxID=1330018 RepID=A0A167RRA1_CALVF|nr:hypothetical protein CALVIDRAFT_594696 [Calocera viscosa TUFC12733]
MSTGTPSLKITIKRPTSSSNPSPAEESPAPEQKKRKRAAEDDGAEGEPTPPSKRSAREGELDVKRRSKRRSTLLEWTPSPPGDKPTEKSGSKLKPRRSAYDEDDDYDPDRTSPAGSAVIDVEGGVEEPPKKKPTPAAAPAAAAQGSRPRRKARPSAKAAMVMTDEEDDYNTPPPTPPRKPTKGKGRASSAAVTIVARDQRKLPGDQKKPPNESDSQGDAPYAAAVSTTTSTAAAPPVQVAPAEPPKPKLPPIKKKSMLPGTPGMNGTHLPAARDELRTSVSATKANDMYNQLFSGNTSRAQKDRERYDARRQELEAMRAEARKKREQESKNTFDMLAHSAAMNRFEGRLRDRRNWPSPSQIGSAFLMLKHYRPDL